jgi:hypothetical protein
MKRELVKLGQLFHQKIPLIHTAKWTNNIHFWVDIMSCTFANDRWSFDLCCTQLDNKNIPSDRPDKTNRFIFDLFDNFILKVKDSGYTINSSYVASIFAEGDWTLRLNITGQKLIPCPCDIVEENYENECE